MAIAFDGMLQHDWVMRIVTATLLLDRAVAVYVGYHGPTCDEHDSDGATGCHGCEIDRRLGAAGQAVHAALTPFLEDALGQEIARGLGEKVPGTREESPKPKWKCPRCGAEHAAERVARAWIDSMACIQTAVSPNDGALRLKLEGCAGCLISGETVRIVEVAKPEASA